MYSHIFQKKTVLPISSSVDQAVATWNQIQSTYPDIRGVFNWKIDTDEDQGWTFANNVGPLVIQNK